jgi:endonuclease/exonuclease/phosphatase family metal-dependent hydrolase
MCDRVSLATFNAENFYLLMDGPYNRAELEALSEAEYQAMNSSIYNRNKERAKIAEIARLIRDGLYDLVGLCEVGGMETLSAFNRLYLDDSYDCYLHEENSRRGIFVGALARKGRFPGLRASSQPGRFSRNLLRLDLGPEGLGISVYALHLKSQRGGDRGIAERVREIEALSALLPRERCVVMGDFNGIAIRGRHQFEYEPLMALPFRDALEAVGLPEESRRTHYHFANGPSFNQLDYILCSNDLEVLRAGVVEGEIPLNRAQRDTLPSDHLMVWAEVARAPTGEPPPSSY